MTMRVLLVTLPAMADPWRDTQFLSMFDMAEALVDLYDAHVYMLLPSRYKKPWEARFPEGRTGITMVWDELVSKYRFMDRFRMVNNKLVLDNFSRRYGEYQIDWVYCSEPEPASYLKVLMSELSVPGVRPVPILTQEMNIVSSGDKTVHNVFVDDAHAMSRALGYLVSYPVFYSELERDRVLKWCSGWLSSDSIRMLRRRSLIRQHMIATERLDAVLVENDGAKHEKFTVFYGGRISPAKDPAKLLKILRATHAMGGDNIDVRVTVSNKSLTARDSRKIATNFKNSVILGCNRDTFWKEAVQCHVSLCTSPYESFGKAFFEKTYLGLPVLMPNLPWARNIWPSWYPWFYDSEEEAVEKILKIRDQYASDSTLLRSNMKRVREWAVGFVGRAKPMNMLVNFVTPLNQPDEIGHRSYQPVGIQQRKLLYKALMSVRGKKVTMPFIARLIAKQAHSYSVDRAIRATEPRIMADYDIYRTLKDEWGLADDTTRTLSTFTIPAEWDVSPEEKRKLVTIARRG
jgi:glycosyltransferase involved in cell wall biosynthesis